MSKNDNTAQKHSGTHNKSMVQCKTAPPPAYAQLWTKKFLGLAWITCKWAPRALLAPCTSGDWNFDLALVNIMEKAIPAVMWTTDALLQAKTKTIHT